MHLLITPSMAHCSSIVSSSSSLSPLNIIAAPPKATNEGTLDQRFGRKGVKFNDDSCKVELTVRNGSSLKLHIPNGHITSYRPKVYWKDDGFEEVLHTDVDSRGGLGLIIMNNEEKEDKRMGTSSSQWTVKDVDSDSIDALQVELSCTRGALDISYVVSLYPLSMATAVIVKNNGGKAVDLSSAILGHFKFKKRAGTGIQGLRGSSYCSHPPLPSPFQILSPAEAVKPDDHPPGLFSFSFGWEPEKEPGVWCVQEEPMTILKHKLSRVYATPPSDRSNGFHRSAPSKYETLDQGRELFFRVIRMGYEEIYLSSPGASYDKYGKEYYICTGPASMLVPVTVNPGEEWRGAQVIEHDNL